MSELTDLQDAMARWQDAMRVRDELQSLLDRMHILVQEGTRMQESTVRDVEKLLADAEVQVQLLQTIVVGAPRTDGMSRA